jgi:hypothetical protein
MEHHCLQKLIDVGSWQRVGEALQPVLDLSPDCSQAQLLLARHFLHEGDYERCTMATGRVLKVFPSHTEALLIRGSAFFKLEVLPPTSCSNRAPRVAHLLGACTSHCLCSCLCAHDGWRAVCTTRAGSA